MTSRLIIENFASVSRRHFGYTASEKAWSLEQDTIEEPMPDHPYLPVGTGYIPIETEADLRPTVEAFADRVDECELLKEARDDRYVLETVLAGGPIFW